MRNIVLLGLLGVGVIASTEPDVARMILRGGDGLFKRQTSYCSGEGNSCEEQCGPGYETCSGWPYCFNPSKGETCCSGGDFCEAGTYCTTNGCCSNNSTLAQCSASATLATLTGGSSALPSATSSHAAASSSMPGEAAGRQVANAVGIALGAFVLGMPFM